MTLKKNIFVFLIIFLFANASYAIDFTGTYSDNKNPDIDAFGVTCPSSKDCKEDAKPGDKHTITSLVKIGLLTVRHDVEKNLITVVAPTFGYVFEDMTLKGDHFEGKETSLKSTGNYIEGKITKEIISAHLTKGTGSKSHIVVRLSQRDRDYNQLIIDHKKLLDAKGDLSTELDESKTQGVNKDQTINDLKNQITLLDKDKIALKEKADKDIKALKEQLRILQAKPPKINVAAIPMSDKITADGVNLRSANSDNAKIYKTLKKGQKVRRLSNADGTWNLIVTENGIMGYVLSDYINSIDDPGHEPPPPPGQNEINVESPCKIIKSGQTCNVPGSGIVTVNGNINMKKFKAIEVLVNEEVADFYNVDGIFEIILFDIAPGDNDITVSAIDGSGKRKELSFNIAAH